MAPNETGTIRTIEIKYNVRYEGRQERLYHKPLYLFTYRAIGSTFGVAELSDVKEAVKELRGGFKMAKYRNRVFWKVVNYSKKSDIYTSCQVLGWLDFVFGKSEKKKLKDIFLRKYSHMFEAPDGLVFSTKRDALDFMYVCGGDVLFRCKVKRVQKMKAVVSQISNFLNPSYYTEGKFDIEKVPDSELMLAPTGTYHAEGIILVGEPIGNQWRFKK